MALQYPVLHCLLDREPASFHPASAEKPIVFAVNLSLECPSVSGSAAPIDDEEVVARDLFDRFLQAVQQVRFHVWKYVTGQGLAWVGKVDGQISETSLGAAGELLAWLDKEGRPASTSSSRYWSTSAAANTQEPTEITVQAAGAADRLRAAQSWNAPIAHKFGLTHLLRPASKGLGHYLVLPYFADPGEHPEVPTTAGTVADPNWDVSYDPLGGLGRVICRTELLSEAALPLDLPGEVDDIIGPEGFLKVDCDAVNLWRVARWFEERAATLLAVGPALASSVGEADRPYEALFEPSSVPAEPGTPSPIAVWAAAAGLCAALDTLVIGLLKPASGDDSEGPILAPLVTALLEELERPAFQDAHKLTPENLRAPFVTGALRDTLRHSPLAQRNADRAQLAAALRHVHGIGKPGSDASPEAAHIETLLRIYEGASGVVLDPARLSVTEEQGLAMLMRGLAAAEQRLQDEAGLEAATLRLIETSAPAFNGPPARLIAENYAEAIGRPGDEALIGAIESDVVPSAWAAFRTLLDGAFNGAEAARRAAGSEFLKLVLERLDGTERSRSTQFRELARDADYFGRRLLGEDGATAEPGCFATLSEALPTPAFPGTPEDRRLVHAHLARAYAASIAGLDRLLDPLAHFIPENAPHPLPIQIAADMDGARVDVFAQHLNGIGVCLRRIDSTDDSKNLWAHANLAELTWPHYPDKPASVTTVEAAIHPMLPAVSDGRAPMFIDFQGFPFASTELLETRLPNGTAEGERSYTPFYRHGSSTAPGFARVPRLAYGRWVESLSFVTTNAGTLPLILQHSAAQPWMPKHKLQAPSETTQGTLIARVPYSRRTAIGQTAVEEKRQNGKPLRIGAPLAAVAPLAADYPRIGVYAEQSADGARDLFRESDGRGALVIGSATASDMTNSWQLADIRWIGAPSALDLRFFDGPTAHPDHPGIANVSFEQLGAANEGKSNAVDLAAVDVIEISSSATRSDPYDAASPLDVVLTVSCGSVKERRTFQSRSDTLRLRLVLKAAGGSATMSFTDTGARAPDGVDAPLLLLAPEKDGWNGGLSDEVTVTLHTPRIGYLDFDRWLGNADLRKRIFKDDAIARRFEGALLAAYLMRHQDESIAAALDRLPDPAVEQIRIELILLDQLAGTPAKPGSATFEVSAALGRIAKALKDNMFWTPERLRSEIFDPIAQAFCCTITLGPGSSLSLAGKASDFTATIPAGHVARLSVDALVPAEHFSRQGIHPPVFDSGLLQFATRAIDRKHLAFPAAAVRVETMLTFTPAQQDKEARNRLAAEMITVQPIRSSRRYEIVTRDQLPKGPSHAERTRFWRLIGEIDVTSQRWRPSGRPIYHHINPRDFREDGQKADTPLDPAVELRLDQAGRLARFEGEAFFDRSNLDAQSITQKLLPLPSRTVLQPHFWDQPSATYFRHRFTLRSRYAGALRAGRELMSWSAEEARPETGWTMRVAMLADQSRIMLTRPQLRALIPLTTAPGGGADRHPGPPVIGVLQEPPFARGGLADRIASEIKTGFGYGFEALPQSGSGKQVATVEILDARKEIGPTPYLDYRPMDKTRALGMTLMAEGPVGLTFDHANATAPAFPNSLVMLSPRDIGDAASDAVSLEEHFLGVSLRRHLDPAWTTEETVASIGLDAERGWWIELDLQKGMPEKLLRYGADGAEADLLLSAEAGGALVLRTLKLAVDGHVAGAKDKHVDIARLPSIQKGSPEECDFAKLVVLHQPVSAGRYSLSVFAVPTANWVDTAAGRSSAPLMLASFEWSPPAKDKGKGKKELPVAVTLTAAESATARAAMASLSTFLVWTRTSRDFDFVHVAEQKQPDGSGDQNDFAAEPVPTTELVAMLTANHEKIQLMRSGSNGQPAWLISSTLLSPFPLHVHRHLAALTTRYLDEPGRPVETFCRSSLLAGAVNALVLPSGAIKSPSAEDRVRIVEFETPAAILCGTPSEAIPLTYHKAYFDLTGTGLDTDIKGMRLLIRLVGSPAHLHRFSSLELELADANKNLRKIEIQLDNGAKSFTKALELRVEGERIVSVQQLRSDGEARLVPHDNSAGSFAMPTKIRENSGFFIGVKAKGGAGEFWADVSLLHVPKPLSGAFEFDWLFGRAGGDEPALEVTPQALRQMVEAQARIVAVSPPIPIISHDGVLKT